MTQFVPRDPDFDARVRTSFARQRLMQTLGVRLLRVAPGECDMEMPFAAAFTQQHGFLHAGTLTSVVDSACGYAALSLMAPGAAVMSVEFKVNLMAPAAGERLLARGRVVRSGRTLTIVAGEGFMCSGDDERHVFTMLGTMMAVEGRAGIAD
ncbi:PaaI family thioesterase [Wenzhouxiangella sp. XN24]|uniref:PaaI family thioesterase n=1 Tax=Wenzhouxiangella sp. XN24 TaxID=2713569 RepID=UPI0013EB3F7A|nr:PaaI family thioesterase [Wenzhouxiangella sp. XN24]NGX16771.1 PaaI family thioesterase [Wenzhouxiangella sp. XN24]